MIKANLPITRTNMDMTCPKANNSRLFRTVAVRLGGTRTTPTGVTWSAWAVKERVYELLHEWDRL